MNIYLYENHQAVNFDPIAKTRAAFDIRFGSETFIERVQSIFPKRKTYQSACRQRTHQPTRFAPQNDSDSGKTLVYNHERFIYLA